MNLLLGLLSSTLTGTTLKCPRLFLFHFLFFIEASWIDVILTHLSTSFYPKESLLLIWVVYLLGIFPMCLNALLLSMASGFVYVRYESLAFLHYAAISVEIGLVSHSVHRLDQLHDRRFLRLSLAGHSRRT